MLQAKRNVKAPCVGLNACTDDDEVSIPGKT